MRTKIFFPIFLLSFQLISQVNYSWLDEFDPKQSLVNRIAAPDGYKRVDVSKGSFGEWLRNIPLLEGNPPVYLYNGKLKSPQTVHAAVVNIDVGKKDLQQCADAVMRLRAEYLFSVGENKKIKFHYSNGKLAEYDLWKKGYRPSLKGNTFIWYNLMMGEDSSHKSFMAFMEHIFSYCGTLTLSGEMNSLNKLSDMMPGDVFIKGGSPGHAVTISDVAINSSGEKVFLIAQSYMPAQQIHILKNFNNSKLSPWYSVSEIKDELNTPEWVFYPKELKRF